MENGKKMKNNLERQLQIMRIQAYAGITALVICAGLIVGIIFAFSYIKLNKVGIQRIIIDQNTFQKKINSWFDL